MQHVHDAIDDQTFRELMQESLDGEFKPCVMPSNGDTEIVMSDCVIIWERWDEKTEVGKDENGLLVAVRLLGFVS